jgi:hypothetical protein
LRCGFHGANGFLAGGARRIEKNKPDIMLLAEASKPELLAQAFDIDYD